MSRCATPACRSRAVELDSWFYRHETPARSPRSAIPHDVPPSGAWEWKPRDARSAFDPPAARTTMRSSASPNGSTVRRSSLHARHISPESPDVDRGRLVGRRPRRPPARSGLLPPLVRRRGAVGRHLHRAGLDAHLLVRRPRAAAGAGPGRGVAAGAQRARPATPTSTCSGAWPHPPT